MSRVEEGHVYWSMYIHWSDFKQYIVVTSNRKKRKAKYKIMYVYGFTSFMMVPLHSVIRATAKADGGNDG